MQVNDEYAAVKDMPAASTRENVGAKPGDNGLQSLRVPGSEQPTTNAGIIDTLSFNHFLSSYFFIVFSVCDYVKFVYLYGFLMR